MRDNLLSHSLFNGRIILEFKLINWKYMNFTLKVKESINIFSIKSILRDRHGRMDDLKICFKSFTEGNEVKNDMLTLAGILKLHKSFFCNLCSEMFIVIMSIIAANLYRLLLSQTLRISVRHKNSPSHPS